MLKKKETSPSGSPDVLAAEQPKKALLFELENVAVSGRQIIFDVLSDALKDKEVKLTMSLYTLHCLYLPVKNFIAPILEAAGKKKLSEDKLVGEIVGLIKDAVMSDKNKLNSGLDKIINGAVAKGVMVGALTSFEESVGRSMMTSLGLPDATVTLFSCYSEDKVMPSADAWLKLAKKVGVSSSKCVAIVTSSRSARAALSAGMRCVVVPDKYTSFQDFGGSDYVCESLNKDAVEEILTFI